MRAFNTVRRLVLAVGTMAALGAPVALAQQVYTPTLPAAMDRWVYPFGDQDGQRTSIPLFTTLGSGYLGFDDKDAQGLIGFTSAVAIPPMDPSSYRIDAASVTVYINLPSGQPGFAYDPTYDAAATYVPGGNTPDADLGRPIELYAVGYRGGFTKDTFLEDSPFASEAPAVQPARANRNAFPTDFGGPGGQARDVSNNITDFSGNQALFETFPLALGVAVGVAAPDFLPPLGAPPAVGELVPNRTQFRFVLDVSRPEVQAYLRQGLSTGRVNLIMTSMASATAFGAGPITYPILYSQENVLGRPAELSLTVVIGSACNLADIAAVGGTAEEPGAADGQLTVDDIIVFVNLFSDGSGCSGTAPCNRADVTAVGGPPGAPEGELTVDDIIAFFNAYSDGC